MRRLIRQFVPSGIRLQLRLWQRERADRSAKLHRQFARPASLPASGEVVCQLSQPIFHTSGSEAKKHNLALAIGRVSRILIRPGEVFSFWQVIGPPTAANGFQKGRNIINGELKTGYGGGLCQMAGLLYHLGLIGGLDPIERHPHSLDLYREEERYTPLGADATVVYGYKDLRLRNRHPNPVWFAFELSSEEIRGKLWCSTPINTSKVEFKRTTQDQRGTTVETWREIEGKGELLFTVHYLKWDRK